jgi:hypothetical protein
MSANEGLGSYVWYVPQQEAPPWVDDLKDDIREGAPVPFSPPPIRVVYTHSIPPQWEMPDYDAEPWEDIGEECVKFYETPTYVYNRVVPEMSWVTINRLSYQWNIPLVVGDTFVVEVLRNHDTLARWEDRVIRITGDLGSRFVIASHSRPAPCFARFDRNDVIGARVTFRGQFPFGVPNNVPIPGLPRFRVMWNGWRSTISNNVIGQAKNNRVQWELMGPAFDRAMELVKLRGGRF